LIPIISGVRASRLQVCGGYLRQGLVPYFFFFFCVLGGVEGTLGAICLLVCGFDIERIIDLKEFCIAF